MSQNHYTKNQTLLNQSEIRDYNEQGTLGETKTHYLTQYQRKTQQEKDVDVVKNDVEELGGETDWKARATDQDG